VAKITFPDGTVLEFDDSTQGELEELTENPVESAPAVVPEPKPPKPATVPSQIDAANPPDTVEAPSASVDTIHGGINVFVDPMKGQPGVFTFQSPQEDKLP
jgi:hypothetical protein